MSDDPIVTVDAIPSDLNDDGPAGNGTNPERRHHLRFPFTASVEAVEPVTNTKIAGRTTDIGLGGCYVDTISPFPAGTKIKIQLKKETLTFEAEAKVVVSQVGMGMGVQFTSAMGGHKGTIQRWLDELMGKLPIASDLPDSKQADVVPENTVSATDLVLKELLSVLMRSRVLTQAEGNAMLRKLTRQDLEK